MNTEPLLYIDWDACHKLTASKTVARDILTRFIGDLPKQHTKVIELAETLSANKADSNTRKELADLVHKIHGGSCYCSVPQLKNSIKNLETSLKLKNGNEPEDVSKLVDEFSQQVTNVIDYYNEHSDTFQ